MNNYFFDSYAILEIVKGNLNYDRFKEFTFITTLLNLSEVYYSLLKEMNEVNAKNTINALNMEFIELNLDIVLEASSFRYKHIGNKFSFIDCIGYVSALKNNLKFLTGDNGFEKVSNVEFVK